MRGWVGASMCVSSRAVNSSHPESEPLEITALRAVCVPEEYDFERHLHRVKSQLFSFYLHGGVRGFRPP